MQKGNSVRTSEVLRHITEAVCGIDPGQEQQITSAVLLALCFSTKHVGFEFLRNAVTIYRDDPTQLITKELYPAVAALYRRNGNPQQVERSIRNAIDQAWRTCDRETWTLYFPEGGTEKRGKPSNGAFISRIARLIDLWLALHRAG